MLLLLLLDDDDDDEDDDEDNSQQRTLSTGPESTTEEFSVPAATRFVVPVCLTGTRTKRCKIS